MSSEEDDVFRVLAERGQKSDVTVWGEIEKLPLHVLMTEMVRYLRSLRLEPDQFEHYRAIVLAKPEWQEWVQWKIDQYRAMNTTYMEPVQKLPEGRINGDGYAGLTHIEKFLPLLGTTETIPLVAQFLSFPYIDAISGGPSFQWSAASNLWHMQIPGGPNSVDVGKWKNWWKANKHLYEKDRDGKMHGPAPTRFVVMDGRLPPPLPPTDEELEEIKNTPDDPTLAPLAPIIRKPAPVEQKASAFSPPSSGKRWLLSGIFAGCIGLLVALVLWFRKRTR